jgi:hypothetical protein
MDVPLSAPNPHIEEVFEKQEKKKQGFSVLDFLVILSAFFVIAFLGYLYLNPDKKGADVRNVHRSADVSTILTAVVSYSSQENEVPDEIPLSNVCVSPGHEICKIGPYDCNGLVNLSFLNDGVSSEKLISIPSDPINKSTNGTGYYIVQDGAGRVTVCSPYAERNETIMFTRSVF